MSSPWIVLAITVALIAASAFFVAVEFALIAARRHRLEDAAPDSRAARAALRSASELSVLLAGSQLGITVCTLALGAVTKPAVHHWLTPLFDDWGAPSWLADVAGFVLALIIVTFLHLVVGEMAPKSWAIAHPERSATLLALPMRGFMVLTRPILLALNHMANWFLAKVGVEPVDELESGQDSATLRHLVEHSATVGTLDERYHGQLMAALQLESVTIGELLTPGIEPVSVRADATVAQVREAAAGSGHLRILIRGRHSVDGMVHVRDTIGMSQSSPALDLMRPVLTLPGATPVYEALQRAKSESNHVMVVVDDDRGEPGIITVNDVLLRLLPVGADV
ncbi:hemolysin family protein [Williamsia muralis]|uniref:CBS domain containing-hemolysin-like protein n=1 Tax=Williamsia marianensis TaxID=85044 RepID=A0A2G3PRJ0_WILMA|nr:hemolysin family protein [Williamsia marianensis]PHV68370.1 hypothetical protein CSW57_03825 [Williamsia marianensis]